MPSLRDALIRLASSRADLRPHLLPLLKEAKTVEQEFPKGSLFRTLFPKGSEMVPFSTPKGDACKVIDHERRFTFAGNEPYVTFLLVEDANGRQEWVPPWGPWPSSSPADRKDIDALANKLNKVLKPLGFIRGKGWAPVVRQWSTKKWGGGPPVPFNDVFSACQRLPDYVKVSKNTSHIVILTWPYPQRDRVFELTVSGTTGDLSLKEL